MPANLVFRRKNWGARDNGIPPRSTPELSMPLTATHQQDNSYGGSAIWRVSNFVIPLIINGPSDK